MNDDLRSLHLLLDHTERQRDAALSEHGRLETARRAAASQAEQLVVYRREYEQRWAAEFSREGKIELVRCYQGFMERLSQAVDQQERLATHAALQAERSVGLVRDHEVRAAALRKLIGRRQGQADLASARLEQKQSDELAARIAWMRAGAGKVLGAGR